jgi:hypothetical protein
MSGDLATAYTRWTFTRAAFARGYWLTAALYLVVVARLQPFELVLIGVFQGATVLVAEVPCGVLADAVSRRLSLMVGHVVMGAGMAMAGLVTAFPLLVVSQCLWGLGWAFSSGADVAWITDELDRPDRIDRVLVASARWELLGDAAGVVAFAALAWATSLATAVVVAGVAMALLGLTVVARWPETRFEPAPAGRRWRASASILGRGLRLARADHVILAVMVATLLVNGANEPYGRLLERRLLTLGLPTEPDVVVWFAAVRLAGLALGVIALRAIEHRIDRPGVAERTYALATGVGAVSLVIFALAPGAAVGVGTVLVLSGVALPVVRTAGVVWVNRRTTSAVRATVHSLLSQAEHAGEIVFGLALAAVAGVVSSTAALIGSAALFAATTCIVQAVRPRRPA